MEKSLPKKQRRELISLLRLMRTEYNPYVDEDKEVIESIDLLTEELEFNVRNEEDL